MMLGKIVGTAFDTVFVKAPASVIKSDLVQNYIRDLKSLRAVWNWICGILFLWCCWYGMTHHPDSANTIIITVGGVFTGMMTNYVWSSHLEKKNGSGEDKTKTIAKELSQGD